MRNLLDMFLGWLLLGKLLFCPFHLLGDDGLPGLGLIQHLLGILRETGGHGIRLPGLEKQQLFSRLCLIKGIVHIPFPGYPVKELGVPGQVNAVCGRAMRHALFDRLLAVGCLPCPVCLGDFPAHLPQNIGKPPGGQFRCLYRYGNRAPGNIFIDQLDQPLSCKNDLGTICPKVSGHPGLF